MSGVSGVGGGNPMLAVAAAAQRVDPSAESPKSDVQMAVVRKTLDAASDTALQLIQSLGTGKGQNFNVLA